MSSSTPFPKRPKWPLVTAGVVVLVVAALLGGWWLGRDQGGDPPENTTTPPSPTDTTAADGQVDGCLGGPDRTPEMVLAAQEQADVASDEEGVAFAASLMRWFWQEPWAEPTDAQRTAIVAEHADSSIPELFESAADSVDADTSRWVSTSGALWYVESSTADELVVSLALLPVIDGELATDSRIQATLTLTRSDGVWRWSAFEAQMRDYEDMESIGTAFTSGCG
ncbi:hypothetical protein [Ruania zhangjianzhongii]|uniref:hypothetical protein n=1 Tax=Ruania zhangjianzhongii TaxID=2603206 RepID=UPI0011CAC2CD|nr:hypothetical protein [Ruania zhangjianzhongii]